MEQDYLSISSSKSEAITSNMEKFLEDLISQNTDRFYPDLRIERIQNPNRFYAFPFLGGLFKIIILIPVLIELAFLILFWAFVTIINSFVVLFTGSAIEVRHENTDQQLKEKGIHHVLGKGSVVADFKNAIQLAREFQRQFQSPQS